MLANAVTSLGLILDIIGIWVIFEDRLPLFMRWKRRLDTSQRRSLLKRIKTDRELVLKHDRWMLTFIRCLHKWENRASSVSFRTAGIEVSDLRDEDGLLDPHAVNEAFDRAYTTTELGAESTWEPPRAGLYLIMIGFALQLVGVWL